MRIFVIGDVQGCADALKHLLKKIKFVQGKDQAWFVGDLVNRGPDSLGVLRLVRSMEDSAVCVLGNHDLHLLALAKGNQQKDKANPGLDAVIKASDSRALLRWLRHRPLIHSSELVGFTMVHAGLPPQWDLKQAIDCGRELETVLQSPKHHEFLAAMYGNKPEQWDKKLTGIERWRYITNSLTRMRYVTASGQLELRQKGSPDSVGKNLMPWFMHPKRRSHDTRIVFGHWSTLGYYKGGNVYGVDSGCLWGGELTALQIYPEIKRFKLPCKAAHKP